MDGSPLEFQNERMRDDQDMNPKAELEKKKKLFALTVSKF